VKPLLRKKIIEQDSRLRIGRTFVRISAWKSYP
jgi:hypothetical protein